ncbi:MAG: stage II sporulation protein D [Oscillospiraceae bacterium]|nr:stage II sporulation protein D [Oscillospiraceae bacterium]
MKKMAVILFLFAFLTFTLPFAGLLMQSTLPDLNTASSSVPESSSSSASAPIKDEPVLVLDEVTGQINTLTMREYVIGAVMAEMPATYAVEAMKAQAVAAHTYALALKAANANDDTLQGAWFKASPSMKQGYMTEDSARLFWGDAFDTNYAKVSGAVDSVLNEVLLYDGAPASTCYHAISNGQTEASENVWHQALPYLVSVDSTFDTTADNYEYLVTFTPQQMTDALSRSLAGSDFSGSPSTWFGEITYTPAGYVAEIQAGGVGVKGTDFRSLLGLRSACFTLEYIDNVFAITTRGYGHGVGLSQYGANTMALTGSTYSEILAHYYPGTQLSQTA